MRSWRQFVDENLFIPGEKKLDAQHAHDMQGCEHIFSDLQRRADNFIGQPCGRQGEIENVVAVAVFNIVSTLVLVVNDKRADIAILRSQGASRGDVLGVFMIYGAVIGGVGTLLGAVLGVLLSLAIGDLVAGAERLFNLQLLRSDVYPISYLPSAIRAVDVMFVSAIAYAMTIVASLYPAWRASRLLPAETLRQH